MSEIVGAFSQGRCLLGSFERGLASFFPDATVDGVREQATAFAAEQAPVGRGGVLGDVLAQQFAEARALASLSQA